MRQIVYQIIYSSKINFLLRNTAKVLSPVLPEALKIPPSGIIDFKFANGKKLRLFTNQTSYITKLLFWEGGISSFEYADIFMQLAKKVDSFYDIGANIGLYSLIAAKMNGSIKVVGFEPAAGPLHYFRENIELNKIGNINAEALALSGTDGEIDFYEICNRKYKYLKHNLSGESNAGSKTAGRTTTVSTVRSMTLDNYVKHNNVMNIDLIKIDTEGTEGFILSNAARVLSEMRPIVICETLYDTIEPELEKIMGGYGYEFFNHIDSGLKKVVTIIRDRDDGVRNCFFVPPEKFEMIKEFVVT